MSFNFWMFQQILNQTKAEIIIREKDKQIRQLEKTNRDKDKQIDQEKRVCVNA